MIPRLVWAGATLLLALSLWAGADDPPVIHLHVFLSPDCPTCEPVKEAALRKAGRKIGCTIKPRYFDIVELDNYRILLAFERRFGDSENEFPVVIVDGTLLGGEDEIRANLDELLTKLAAAGGAEPVPLPTAEEIARALHLPVLKKPVHLVFFDRPACRQCGRVGHLLAHYQQEIGGRPSRRTAPSTGEEQGSAGEEPLLVIHRIVGADRETRLWQEVLSERAAIAENQRLIAPTLFVGSDALVDTAITDSAVAGLLTKYRDGSPPPDPPGEQELSAARSRLNERFRNIGLAAVLVGGLVDGVNPCAFVTLIFLVSYLAASKRRGRDILLVGSAFTAAVFCAYLLTGIGLASAIEALEVMPRIAQVFTWGLVALTFTLAGLSAWDVLQVRRGRSDEMKLTLPAFLRRRVSLTIAREFRTRTVLTAAFVAGFLVSLFELVCTGQIYLPLIRLMVSFSASRARALGFLVAYNVAFVVPLIATFAAVYAGSTSEQLTGLLQRHLALSKVLATLLFLAMGVLLIFLA